MIRVTEIEYRVHSGDTLTQIAYWFLGDANRYPEIAEYNGLEDPDVIHAGQSLRIRVSR